MSDIHEQFDDDETETLVDETEPNTDAFSEQKTEEDNESTEESTETVAEDQKAEETKEEVKDDKMVPYAALHEERQNRKELQREMNEMRERLGALQNLKDELNELRKGNNTQSEELRRQQLEQEFEDDPISALRRQNEALQARLDAQETEKHTKSEEQRQLEAQQNEFQQMLSTVASQVQEFEANHKDYPEAFKFLYDKRVEEYRALGITDQIEINKEFDREAIAISANALQRGVNPGEAVYNLAKARGYTRVEALEGVEDPQAKTTLEESMDRLEKGTKASQSLTGGGGGKPEGSLTVAEIEKMSDDEFDKLWDKMSGGSIY